MRTIVILCCILIIAAILRLWNLGSQPPSAYGDEISFAWNAWSILKTGADEYGQSYPLQFRAFDDYKSPLPVYLLVPFIQLLGLNTFAVRLPVALFAIFTVLMTYFLGRELFDKKIALGAALLIAISPWHMHLSRGYFESTIALFFLVSAVFFFVKAREQRYYLIFSSFLFVATLYTYFTPRIMLLFFIPFLIWWGRRWVFVDKKIIGISSIVFICLVLPLLWVTLFDSGLSRLNKLTAARNEKLQKQVIDIRNSVGSPEIIKKVLHNRPVYWVRDVLGDYLEHFSPNFWYLYGDSSLRYFLGNMGMFYLFEMPFLIIGLLFLRKSPRQLYLLLAWMLFAPIPSALVGRPFAVRSLALLPAPFFLVVIGMTTIWSKINRFLVVRLLIVCFFSLSLGYYLVRYHLEYSTYAATWWGWENKAAIDLAIKEKDMYDQVFISNFYTGAELALAYYTGYDPVAYREAKKNLVTLADGRKFVKIDNFYIGSLDLDSTRYYEGILPAHSLYIARPEEFASDEKILAPDDKRTLFYVYRKE